MVDNREITAARKEGNIEQAYELSKRLVSEKSELTDWDVCAVCWTVNDLLKECPPFSPRFNECIDILKKLDVDILPEDKENAKNTIYYWIKKSNPFFQKQQEADNLSKNDKHEKALVLYKEILEESENPEQFHLGYGWALYRAIKKILSNDQSKGNEQVKSLTTSHVNLVYDYLLRYAKLSIEKPSKLHSCILYLVLGGYDVLTKVKSKFDYLKFVLWWDFNNFQEEDYCSHFDNKGREYPSLACKAIKKACDRALEQNDFSSFSILVSYIDKITPKTSNPIWLNYSKIKIFIAMGKLQEAKDYAISFIKHKNTESWAWGLLALCYMDTDKSMVISCYCKALTCPQEINFTQKIKIRLAEILAEQQLYEQAKIELSEVIAYKQEQGHHIGKELERLFQSDWFQQPQVTHENNTEFYLLHKDRAEAVIFEDLPWRKAILGEYYIKKDSSKKRYKLYVESSPYPFETSVSSGSLNGVQIKAFEACKVKGDFVDKKFSLYAIEKRESDRQLDIFTKQVGVIDHINNQKNLVHILISKQTDCVVEAKKINFPIQLGTIVDVYLAQNDNKRYAVRIYPSHSTESTYLKSFSGQCRLTVSGEIGFVDDIYVSADLIQQYNIDDDELLTGTAVLNYDKKQRKWGWKAIKIIK